MNTNHRPNIIFVFGDQWRAQATGYAGDPNVHTPNLDRFAGESIHFTHAVANCPVCSPWRATLMTGQYPLTHGVFVNDVPIQGHPKYMAECFREAGYDTAYIGKWHIDGHGRSAYIPPQRRKGFGGGGMRGHWKVRECTHDYNDSFYYADGPDRLYWEGYDAIAQTKDAQAYICSHHSQTVEFTAAVDHTARPFLLMLSWGPPHDPYETAPEAFRRMYDPADIELRPNVPADIAPQARRWLAGYYAHCSALDWCFGELMNALDSAGLADNTLVVFTSDHGDMLGSHGARNKQRPWDESILVPMLLRWPAMFECRGWNMPKARQIGEPFNSPDWMPTLLGLAGIAIPDTVEGHSWAPFLQGTSPAPDKAALIELPACFHQYAYHNGGRDWRGLRTRRYTYVIDHHGPWMLYDNETDPYQMSNMVNQPVYAHIQTELDADLHRRLAARGDKFLPGQELIHAAGYPVDDQGDPCYEP